MIRNWLTEDHRIDLPKLFGHLGYRSVSKESDHCIFEKNGVHYVAIRTENGFLYYKVQRPQEKLSASDLITGVRFKNRGGKKEMVWDKVDSVYREILETERLLIDGDAKDPMTIVAKDFNHFRSYGLSVRKENEKIYRDFKI